MQVVHPTGVRVESLSIGLNNELFVIDKGDTIYQLMEDGRLEKHLVFPGQDMDDFNVAPDGSFWFTNNGGELYHVDNQGKPQLVASNVNREFDIDSTGNLFAVDRPSDNVQKITPDGKVETIASGFQTQRIRIGPDGSVYIVTFDGELARVEADGSLKIVATGFGVENVPAFAPDGAMYILSSGGLNRVDPSTGRMERVAWYDGYRGLPDTLTLVFDRKGDWLSLSSNHAALSPEPGN